ncbi:MAG: hypothetical protein VYC00_03425, partial [Candidatus Neomarinimicrobiota bacterium]|nr:hypothetical protein [Candidatus Neomarinimicrobiota bacterium]
MNKVIQLFLIIFVFSTHLLGQVKNADRNNSEALSETPLYPIPAEMTFEEYQDMNRRMSIAVAWSAIPVPGVTHHYAGEKKRARQLFYIGLGGLACIIAGAVSMEEETWPDTTGLDGDYEEIAGAWYKKVPIGMEGNQINYKLETVNKESKGSGGGLVALGVLVIVGDLIYDRIWGFRKIEHKRDRVRYKYGQQLQFSVQPKMEPLA